MKTITMWVVEVKPLNDDWMAKPDYGIGGTRYEAADMLKIHTAKRLGNAWKTEWGALNMRNFRFRKYKMKPL